MNSCCELAAAEKAELAPLAAAVEGAVAPAEVEGTEVPQTLADSAEVVGAAMAMMAKVAEDVALAATTTSLMLARS